MQALRLVLLSLLLGALPASAARLVVTVTHDLPAARPAETISVPWPEVNRTLPGALLQHLQVKDPHGNVLPYQVTNIAPQAKDPKGDGVAYGELLFQYDFAAGESSARFTVETTEALAPVFPTKAYVRFVPERLDDLAWENDRIGHRTYGPALAAAAAPGSGKEVLVTSGLDVWCKRVRYPIVDRWYNKGHDHYHKDEGEGMDMYNVGPSRGCGGTGVWDGKQLYVGRNFSSWRILANGPVRAQFELTYETWMANGTIVSEVKRITLDAGHQLNQVDSTFTVHVGPKEIVVGLGLNKTPSDKGQEPVIQLTGDAAVGARSQWVTQKTKGELATAVVVPGPEFAGLAEDDRNLLVLAKATSGSPLRYWVGAAWSRAGDFTSREAWDAYLAAWAARVRAPIRVTCSASP